MCVDSTFLLSKLNKKYYHTKKILPKLSFYIKKIIPIKFKNNPLKYKIYPYPKNPKIPPTKYKTKYKI